MLLEDSQSQHLQRYQASEDDYASNSASGSICLLCFFSTLNLPPSTCPTLSLPSPTLFFVSPLVQGLSSFHDDLIARQVVDLISALCASADASL
ncbi:protein PRD1 [Prunus yedoensis var. nudiflora]|uniref:Protein PRD1 n=1 Tax=Prunus yedoensis var. nudiflora TaxID=2094558 RepID=A0A314UBT8_PRUYE|nr:protein PRD1 [Prunus yedoensis var. nudiflora]